LVADRGGRELSFACAEWRPGGGADQPAGRRIEHFGPASAVPQACREAMGHLVRGRIARHPAFLDALALRPGRRVRRNGRRGGEKAEAVNHDSGEPYTADPAAHRRRFPRHSTLPAERVRMARIY
jgi:hypothetical protein